MSDYGDYSDDEFLDLDFLDDYTYVEDGYHIADDLAERAIASPPPYDDGDDYIDWDRFNYWDEIEDGSVGYFDYEGRSQKGDNIAQKRLQTSAAKRSNKNQGTLRGDLRLSPTPTVKWRSQASRSERPIPLLEPSTQRPIALLKDWKERFSNSVSMRTFKKPSIEIADEASSIVATPLSPSPEASFGGMEIDEEALKAALASRLGGAGAGMEGLDPAMLLEYAMRMLGGEEDADDVAGELAEDLLDRDDDDPSTEHISSFLSRQREAAKEQENVLTPADSSIEETLGVMHTTPLDSKSSNAFGQIPTPSSSNTSNNISSLADAESPLTIASNKRKRTTEAQTPGAPSQGPSRKRKAGSPEAEHADIIAPRAKRAQRGFDAPTAASTARTFRTTSSTAASSKARKP